MRRDIPRPLKAMRAGAGFSRLGGARLAMICLVALLATGVWWAILSFGGRAAGYPLGEHTLLVVLGCICLLLVLGLSMAAMAASDRDTQRGASQENLVASARTRRKAG